MVERGLPKPETRVRFPSPAPNFFLARLSRKGFGWFRGPAIIDVASLGAARAGPHESHLIGAQGNGSRRILLAFVLLREGNSRFCSPHLALQATAVGAVDLAVEVARGSAWRAGLCLPVGLKSGVLLRGGLPGGLQPACTDGSMGSDRWPRFPPNGASRDFGAGPGRVQGTEAWEGGCEQRGMWWWC